MKIAGIEREEIILMLTELNNQVGELEVDLRSSTEEFQKGWYRSHESRLNNFDIKLTALKESTADLGQSSQDVRLKLSGNKAIKLELGF